MNSQLRSVLLCLFFAGFIFSSCEKKWDDHNAVGDPILSGTLLEQINKNPELSKFSDYLVQTGYDKVLASSKTFTVWAPTNQALEAVDAALLDTPEELLLFVGNHIANQSFLTEQIVEPFIRVKTLNGKNVSFGLTAVDGSPLVSKDRYVGNGVLHTISTAITPKVSAWEYLMSTNSKQKEALVSFNYEFFDFSKAEQIGINPQTGEPIYKEGTGLVERNSYLDRVNISNEDSLFTYIVLSDDAFDSERTKLTQYYTLGSQDSTEKLTNFNVVKDLAFRGILNSDNFPADAYSFRDSVRFHLNKNAITATIPVSNGVVYVMNSINYDLMSDGVVFDRYTKLKPILIEGENINNSTDFLSVKTNTRPTRRNPDGSFYTQLKVENHGTTNYWARYRPSVVNKVKYKVYWRIVRDYNLQVPYSSTNTTQTNIVQHPLRIAFKAPALMTAFPYQPEPGVVRAMNNGVPVLDANGKQVFLPNYEEVYLGEYTPEKYYANNLKSGPLGALNVFLVGNSNTTNGQNTLLLDYIKLIPAP